jgi:hypothetical protein
MWNMELISKSGVSCNMPSENSIKFYNLNQCFFLGGRWGTRTPKHFMNLTGESKNFKTLEFLLNQLQTYLGYLCDLLSFM